MSDHPAGPAEQPGKPTDAWVMLLPPGWARFPTGEGRQRELDEAIEQVVARALPDTMPRDKVEPFRHMLRDELHKTLGQARDAGTGAVYLPTEPMEGVIVPGSIAEIEVVSDVGTDPARIVTSILSDGYEESELVEIDGRPGIRVSSTTHEVQHEGDWPEVSTRQVLYVISRDDAEGAWLALSFSTIWNSHETERLAEALVFFFDAVMGTFSWAGPGSDLQLPQVRTVPGSA